MATTGFWPVKNRLKEVIEYTRNPDKTTDKKFLEIYMQHSVMLRMIKRQIKRYMFRVSTVRNKEHTNI